MDSRIPYSAFRPGAGGALFGTTPEDREALEGLSKRRSHGLVDDTTRGAIPDLDPSDLTVGRWAALVLEADAAAARTALAPLLAQREAEGVAWTGGAGGTAGLVVLRRPAVLSSSRWLRSLDEATDMAPPHYLMLVGGPDRFPFSVEEALSRHFAVGRLDVGDEPMGPLSWAAVRRYAEKIARFSRGERRPRRQALVYSFATDEATRLSHEGLALPFVDHLAAPGTRRAHRARLGPTETLFGDAARTEALLSRLAAEPPALLLTVSHGIEGPVPPAEWGSLTDASFVGARGELALSAAALPATGSFAEGSVVLSFACWSAGVPERSQHRRLVGEADTPIPGAPFVPALPRALLAREDGPVAFLGHVDRATSQSFAADVGGRGAAAFFDLADWYLGLGAPLGKAMETLRERAQSAASALVELLAHEPTNRPPSQRLVNAWLCHNDRAGFALLGDPALRLGI